MINITLPDGSVRTYENDITAIDVARDISEGFARNVVSANFNDITIYQRFQIGVCYAPV